MWPFWRADAENRIDRRLRHFDSALKNSFGNVRKDTQSLGQWVQYLHQKTEQQNAQMRGMVQEIEGLNEELSLVPKTPQDIRKIIDSFYSFDALMGRIRLMEQRVEELALKSVQQPQIVQQPQVGGQELDQIRQKLASLEQKKQSLKEKIIKRITKNSKEYVKSIIFSYIKKYENVAALQLKEMVVDDQQLCSKSSFYRLMEEIEQQQEIGVVREGKEKRYFLKAMSRNS